MIIHPTQQSEALQTVAGRFLAEGFGLIGRRIRDQDEPRRFWTIEGFFSPLPGMQIAGIRARLVDDKKYVTFCNQRDLEVLLDVAKPGDFCRWLGQEYVSPYDQRNWFGFCMDTQDLMDDLFIREVELRGVQQELTGGLLLPTGFEMTRRIHLNDRQDREELLYMRGDFNLETQVMPDLALETIDNRWVSIERVPSPWSRAE